MVKRGKNKKKGASLDEVFQAKAGDDGWHTGSAADMLLDEDAAGPIATAAPEQEMAGAQERTRGKRSRHAKKLQRQGGAGGAAMDTSEAVPAQQAPAAAGAVSKVPGLGVVAHSMKRGDRTARQKKRKVEKLTKAMARKDKVGVRIDSKQQKKQSKLSLRHMY